jgi:tetratricopeptide (TPR) repeat protein
VWQALAQIANERGRCVEWAQAEQQALHHARQAGHELTYLGRLPIALTSGPLPADDALRELAALPSGVSAVLLDLHRAWLLAMLARFPEAQAIASEASEQWREIPGNGYRYAVLAELATLSGDHETAVHHLRSYCDELEEYGQRGLLSTYAPLLGRSLCALDRHDEAETLAQLGRELGGETDRLTQMLWRQVQALVDARRARHADAELLAREAVAIAEQTDMLNTQGDALCDLAQVLQAAGRNDEAAATFEQAVERYERKKNLAKAAQVSELLATLRRDAAKVSESFPSGRVG